MKTTDIREIKEKKSIRLKGNGEVINLYYQKRLIGDSKEFVAVFNCTVIAQTQDEKTFIATVNEYCKDHLSIKGIE